MSVTLTMLTFAAFAQASTSFFATSCLVTELFADGRLPTARELLTREDDFLALAIRANLIERKQLRD